MLNNIQIFRYIETNSLIHKINPLNKLLTLIIFTILILNINNIYFHIIIILYLFMLIKLSKIEINEYLKSIKTILYLLISVFIINIIFKVNIITTLINIFRIVEIVVYSSLIMMTTKTNQLIYGLDKILLPLKIFKINTNKIIFILTMAIKFIPIVIEQINTILKGLISKGIRKNKILVLSAIIIPTINLLLRKAELLSDELELKLYNYNIEIQKCSWKKIDTIIILIYLGILIGGIYAIFNDFFI